MAPDEAGRAPAVSALLTDHYELTMLEGTLGSGVAEHRAVFEVFARRLPEGRRYGVTAGTGRLIEALARFHFGPAELDFLAERRIVGPATLQWLAAYRFSGTIEGYPEGEPFFPGSPILTVQAPLGEALLLETLVLSVLNHDCAVAAAAARMVSAAGGRPLIEAGGRRTHEWAAPAAARAAYLAGFAATSNLEAGRRWGVPTGGTTAHAFTLAHPDERSAFAAQLAAHGPRTTFLVDTYDIAGGITNAVAVAGTGLAAIRIDSGDPAVEVPRARALLDDLGATGCAIVVSGDLDEYRIAALADLPVDRMLVGTQLVVGSGAPTAGLVYKLVAVARRPGADALLEPVAKTSPGKATVGGHKLAYRRYGPDGFADAELVAANGAGPEQPGTAWRPLRFTYVRDGEIDPASGDVHAARKHHEQAMAELPPDARRLDHGEPVLPVIDVT